jgi:hypothetical protein
MARAGEPLTPAALLEAAPKRKISAAVFCSPDASGMECPREGGALDHAAPVYSGHTAKVSTTDLVEVVLGYKLTTAGLTRTQTFGLA